MRIVAINDIHKSAVPPVSRKGNYNECINAKLLEAAEFCTEMGVDVVLITGDFLHRKKPDANPYWLTGESVNILLKFKCPIIAALGNHDWDEVPQRLPYYPIFYIYKLARINFNPMSGIVTPFAGTDPTGPYSKVEFATINSDIGSFADDIIEVTKKLVWRSGDSKKILCVHSPIVPSEFAKEYPAKFMEKAVKMEALDGIADYVFYGDIHDPHGIHALSRTTFVNYGSLARNSAKEINSNRAVQLAYFDTDSGEIQSVDLENVQHIKDAFRYDEILAKKEIGEELENFIETLGSTQFSVLTPEILIDKIQGSTELSTSEQEIAVKVIQKIAT